MLIRMLTIAAAAILLLSACETKTEETSATTGGGEATETTTTTTTIAAPAPGSQEELTIEVGDRIFFDFDKSNVRADQRATLDGLAAWMNKYPQIAIRIEGHADERGTREYNLALGERRANSAREYLIAAGVASERLSTISYGKERPAVLGSNEQAWAQNRRAVFVVVQ